MRTTCADDGEAGGATIAAFARCFSRESCKLARRRLRARSPNCASGVARGTRGEVTGLACVVGAAALIGLKGKAVWVFGRFNVLELELCLSKTSFASEVTSGRFKCNRDLD